MTGMRRAAQQEPPAWPTHPPTPSFLAHGRVEISTVTASLPARTANKDDMHVSQT
jgi:hypothetical protein